MKWMFSLIVVFAVSASASVSGASMDMKPMSAVHGMFAFGEKSLYLSHLPMFHAPHNYQAIFEAVMDEKGMEAYTLGKQDSPDQIVTIVPEAFSLVDMINHPTSFHASLYKGHFERGGTLMAANILVTMLDVVHAHQLGVPGPSDITFGSGDETYSAHFITAPPDVDEIKRLGQTIYKEAEDLRD